MELCRQSYCVIGRLAHLHLLSDHPNISEIEQLLHSVPPHDLNTVLDLYSGMVWGGKLTQEIQNAFERK